MIRKLKSVFVLTDTAVQSGNSNSSNNSNPILTVITLPIRIPLTIIRTVGTAVGTILRNVGSGVGTILSNVGSGVSTIVSTVFTTIRIILTSILRGFQAAGGNLLLSFSGNRQAMMSSLRQNSTFAMQ